RHAPRIPHRKILRAALHGFLRAPGFDLRWLASPAASRFVGFWSGAGGRTGANQVSVLPLTLCIQDFPRHPLRPGGRANTLGGKALVSEQCLPRYFFGCADGGKILFSRKYMAAAA